MTMVTGLIRQRALDDDVVHATLLHIVPAVLGEGIGGNNLSTPRVKVFAPPGEVLSTIDLLVLIARNPTDSNANYNFGVDDDRIEAQDLIEGLLTEILGEHYPEIKIRAMINAADQPLIAEPAMQRPAIDMDLAIHLAKVDAAYAKMVKSLDLGTLPRLDERVLQDVIDKIIDKGPDELRTVLSNDALS